MIEFISTPVGIWVGLMVGIILTAVVSAIYLQKKDDYEKQEAVVGLSGLAVVALLVLGAWPAFHFSGMEAAAEVAKFVFIMAAAIGALLGSAAVALNDRGLWGLN